MILKVIIERVLNLFQMCFWTLWRMLLAQEANLKLWIVEGSNTAKKEIISKKLVGFVYTGTFQNVMQDLLRELMEKL